jgi:DUF1009 family protein
LVCRQKFYWDEGTDECIRRAGTLGRENIIVVKVAKPKQDFRFDVPVVGPRTIESMKEARARVLAVDAGMTLFLDKEQIIHSATSTGITITAVDNTTN